MVLFPEQVIQSTAYLYTCSINTSQAEDCDNFSRFVGWTSFALQISTTATLIPPGSHMTPLNSANSDTGHVEH